MEKLWCLAEVDIFQDLSPSEMDAIAARAPMQTVAAGTVFYSPEQRTEVLFILKQGRVRIFRLSPAGKALTIAIITLVRFQRRCWVLGVGFEASTSPTPNT